MSLFNVDLDGIGLLTCGETPSGVIEDPVDDTLGAELQNRL
ncbi:MAG: hypothetical protein ACRDJE_04540 [Dehalococcoidia bacterium]